MTENKTNTGYYNSGDYNSGNYNSGDRNSGDYNSGNYNSGYRNSGDYNSGDRNSGSFNTDEPTIRMFNKDSGLLSNEIDYPNFYEFYLIRWIEEKDMTKEEKEQHSEYKTTGGYIKKYGYKEAWANFWRDTSEENRQKFLNLPNFSWEIFTSITGITPQTDEKITGIDVEQSEEQIEIDGKRFSVDTIKNALRHYVG